MTALQAGYAPADGTTVEWAPPHRPFSSSSSDSAALPPPTATLTIAPGDRLVRLEVRPGPEGVEALRLTTQKGEVVLCGRRDEPPTVTVDVGAGLTAVAFFGAVGREGVQSLGIVRARLPPTTTTSAPADPPVSFPWGIYTACAVDRATRQMLVWGHGGGCGPPPQEQQVLDALKTARKYLANSLREPANPAFRRVRGKTAFFHRHIGRLPGSGHLMRALGFQHVASAGAGPEAEAEACYELPLARASPVMLDRLVARLDANIARVQALVVVGAEKS